jgi:hypothetical protein
MGSDNRNEPEGVRSRVYRSSRSSFGYSQPLDFDSVSGELNRSGLPSRAILSRLRSEASERNVVVSTDSPSNVARQRGCMCEQRTLLPFPASTDSGSRDCLSYSRNLAGVGNHALVVARRPPARKRHPRTTMHHLARHTCGRAHMHFPHA